MEENNQQRASLWEVVEVLEGHVKVCEEECRFAEAEAIKVQIEQLIAKESARQKEQMWERHAQQRAEVESLQQREFEDLREQ